MTPIFAFGLGPMQIVLILVVGVVIFGRRLPEVGKYLGKGIVEFKKGLKGLEDEFDIGLNSSPAPRHDPITTEPARPPQRIATTAPKFEDGIVAAPPATTSIPNPTAAPKV